jgi:2'-5' RNA ligase
MGRLRTFIAVDPGTAVQDRCVSLQETLSRTGAPIKWVEHDNLHVTLLFLGEVDDRDVVSVCRAVTTVCVTHAPFVLSVEGVGCFPNPRRPRTIWAGLGAGTQELVSLHDALESPLLALGCYRREERQFAPHLTLGRVKGDGPVDQLGPALTRQAGWRGGEAEIDEVLVLSSELRPEGPIYTVLSRAPLQG